MKKLLQLFAFVCLFAAPAMAQLPGYLNVSGVHLTDASDAPVNGTITFAPVSTSGQALSFRINGDGQAITTPVSATVTNGAFTVMLADTNLTSPQNVCYAVTVVDNLTGNQDLGPGYSCVQPSSASSASFWCSNGTCNFDVYQPNVAAQALIQTGPQGVAGPACSTGTGTCNMTVPIVLPGDPTTSTQAADKNYIDVTSHPGVWHREGTIMWGSASTQFAAQEPTVFQDTNPQILVGSPVATIFKLWYTCGWTTEAVCYSESFDGKIWATPITVIAAGNPTSHGYVFKFNGTYYAYEGNSPSASTGFSQYTSTDGVHWTLAHSNVLAQGASGAPDAGPFGNIYVIPNAIGSTWYALYEARASNSLTTPYVMHVATSPDGFNWTKYSGNPVITGPGGNGAGGPEVHLINGTWYVWGQCSTNPTDGSSDICRWHSPDFLHWTPDNNGNPVMSRATADEGLNSVGGQIADPSMVAVGNSVYIYDDAVGTQATPTENNNGIHLKLAIAPYTFAQLVATNEGNGTNLDDIGVFDELELYDCVYWGNGFGNFIPCANSTGRFDVGALNFIGGLDQQVNFNNYFNGTTTLYAANGVAAQLFSGANNEAAFNTAPVGVAGQPVTFTQNWSASPAGFVIGTAAGTPTKILQRVVQTTNLCTVTTANGTCTFTLTVPNAFPDTSWNLICYAASASGGPGILWAGSPALSTTTTTVGFRDLSGVANNALQKVTCEVWE